jgi:oligoendopeptidase F
MKDYTTQRSFDEITPHPTPEYWKETRKEVEQLFKGFITKRKDNTSYLSSPEKLKEALDDYDKIQGGYGLGSGSDFGVIGAESYYYWLQKVLNSNDETILSTANQADEFATKMHNEMLFFELSLSQISPEKQSEFLSSPMLTEYRHFLERRFQESKHLLTPEAEKVLNILTKTSYYNRDEMRDKMLSKQEAKDPKS